MVKVLLVLLKPNMIDLAHQTENGDIVSMRSRMGALIMSEAHDCFPIVLHKNDYGSVEEIG